MPLGHEEPLVLARIFCVRRYADVVHLQATKDAEKFSSSHRMEYTVVYCVCFSYKPLLFC